MELFLLWLLFCLALLALTLTVLNRDLRFENTYLRDRVQANQRLIQSLSQSCRESREAAARAREAAAAAQAAQRVSEAKLARALNRPRGKGGRFTKATKATKPSNVMTQKNFECHGSE